MSDERPRYGEYATPEQQRAAAGLPPASDAPVAPAGPAAPSPAPSKTPPRMERMIAAVLLGIGLVNVLGSIPGFLDLSSTMNRTLQAMGIDGEFTNVEAARVWGPIAAVVLLCGYVATAALAFRRMRLGRTSWWVPLVGLVVTMALVSACLAVPMLGDPAFTQGLLTPPAG